jgi:multiple sugar transport system substrate-binding protein
MVDPAGPGYPDVLFDVTTRSDVRMNEISRRKLVGAGAAVAAGLSGVAAASAAGANREQRAALAQGDKEEIVFYHIWGTPPGGEAAATKHPAELLIDAFNEQSTTTHVTGQTPGNYFETLQKAQADMAAGNVPALVITPWSNIHYAVEGLGVVPLEEVGGDDFETVFSNVKDSVKPLVQLDGDTVGMPFAFSCPIFYYNADILAEAGVDADTLFATWDSLAEGMKTIQGVLNGNPVIGISYNKDWPAQTIIQSNGGRVINDDGEFVVDSPESTEAMQTIADLDAAGLYDRGTSAELRPSFVGGSTAIYVGSVASLGGLKRDVPFTLGTAPFPTFGDKPRKASSGGSFIGVYAREDAQRAAAWEFLTYALSEPGYTIWMQTGYLNATNYDIPVIEGQEAAYTQLDEGLTSETQWPGARAAEAQVTWGTYCERIWANDIGVEEGLKEAISEVDAIIG